MKPEYRPLTRRGQRAPEARRTPRPRPAGRHGRLQKLRTQGPGRLDV